MKKIIFAFIALVFCAQFVTAQNKDDVMEKRAKAMHEAIANSDKKIWEKFIKENYSATLLKKYDLDHHMEMFEMVHNDFGDTKIVALKAGSDSFTMIVERTSDKHRVSFELTPEKKAPFKIEGFGIEAGELGDN